ncbi:hypothetical protein N658DRAFT_462648 [Parathielavia hyrcaniae]|uniref:Sm domain-containing protein n=1 Tax=Parathielavia hyrcaniae TaxID=113614 RepID=A0AAN6Q852_9PEZI|nr:hypothetical protein N658DRAFT_462648 [Parathielavia hyrcaniae]
MSTSSTSPNSQPQNEEALTFLRSLINKNLRVTTTDGRLFWGTFKCTDAQSNIILQHTYEYRQPSAQQLSEAVAAAAKRRVRLDMTSRYLGLVVVPGHVMTRIEVEEFASQMRGREVKVVGGRGGHGVAVS